MSGEGQLLRPIERAARVYDQERCSRTFNEDLEIHLIHGFVFSTPSLFIMGRPVDRSAPASNVREPTHIFAKSKENCWHIFLAAGDMSEFPRYMPYFLPFLSWERENKLRFYHTTDILGILCKPSQIDIQFGS